MENTKSPMDKKKLFPLILVSLIIIVLIIIFALSEGKDKTTLDEGNISPVTEQSGEEAGLAPEEGSELGEGEDLATVNPVLIDAVAQAPGTNLISKEGKVITDSGKEVRTDVSPMAEEAPRQSLPIEKNQVAPNSILIDASSYGFSPSEFSVEAGKAITIALTSADQWSHNIKFEDPSLVSAGVAVSAGTTRAVTFNAPTTPGEYRFVCDIPGHAARGEVGKMIVK